jgi:shikimate dehydrogenase
MSIAAVPISGRTRILGVIGDPIAHSRSPAMHNAAFRALGLGYAYVPFHVRSEEVPAAIAAVRALGLVGLNVTLPHKEAVLAHLDRLTPAAQACAAVNTIINRDGVLAGDNTDVTGLVRDLGVLGISPRRKLELAVVLGSGGSARAVVFALGRFARRIVVAARRRERAVELVRGISRFVRAKLQVVPLADLASGARAAETLLGGTGLVINATSLGMRGEPFLPLAYAATPRDCVFYDLVYTARRTPFLLPAARLRRPVANGLGMLLHQGAAAFELWTGVTPPLDVMRRALLHDPT